MSFYIIIVMGTVGAALLYYVMLKQIGALRRRSLSKKGAPLRLRLFWCAACRRRTPAQRSGKSGTRAACAYCGAAVHAETPEQRARERRRRQQAEAARQRAYARHRRAEQGRRQTEQERLWAEYLAGLHQETEERPARPARPRDGKAVRCRAVLGVTEDASLEEIKARYRALALQYHPDKTAHLGEKLRAVAETETRRINEAYGYLCKKHRRQKNAQEA